MEMGRLIHLPQSTIRDPGGDIVTCPLTRREFVRNGHNFIPRSGAELPKEKNSDQAYATY